MDGNRALPGLVCLYDVHPGRHLTTRFIYDASRVGAEGSTRVSTHRRSRPTWLRWLRVVVVSLLVAMTGSFAVASGALASPPTGGGKGYVTVYNQCTGIPEVSIQYHNNDATSPVFFTVKDTVSGKVLSTSSSSVPPGQVYTGQIAMHKNGTPYDLTATSSLGYSERFQGTFDCGAKPPPASGGGIETSFTLQPPTWVDKCGTQNDTYILHAKNGVGFYDMPGRVAFPLVNPPRGLVTIHAIAFPGFRIIGQDTWSYTFTDVPCAPPAPISVTPATPTLNGNTLTVPSTSGVDYLLNGKVVAPGTYPVTGTVTVTVVAKTGYTLTGTSSWSFTAPPVVIPPVVPPAPQPPVVVGNPPPVAHNPPVVVPPAPQPPVVHQPPVLPPPIVVHAPVVAPPVVVPAPAANSPVGGGQLAPTTGLNPGFGANTGWEETSPSQGNSSQSWLLVGLAALSVGLAVGVSLWLVRRRMSGDARP